MNEIFAMGRRSVVGTAWAASEPRPGLGPWSRGLCRHVSEPDQVVGNGHEEELSLDAIAPVMPQLLHPTDGPHPIDGRIDALVRAAGTVEVDGRFAVGVVRRAGGCTALPRKAFLPGPSRDQRAFAVKCSSERRRDPRDCANTFAENCCAMSPLPVVFRLNSDCSASCGSGG